jgi:hypothetical protein
MDKKLALTIHGPFAYVDNFPNVGFVTLMAPMCPQHKGGISSLGFDDEYGFHGNFCNTALGAQKPFIYNISIKVTPASFTDVKGEGVILSTNDRPKDGFDPATWRFWLTLPKPDYYVTVNPAKAIVSKPNPVPNNFAVGIRFIYKTWDGSDIDVILDGKVEHSFKYKDFGEDNRMDLEIEYSASLREDADHEDAVHCFEKLASSLKLPWTITIPPRTSIDEQHIRPPFVGIRNDCKAAVIRLE